MLIVIEGVDGSGKSTLVKQLRDELPGYLWIAQANGRGKPDTNQIQAAADWIQDGGTQDNFTIICDRHVLISEEVYGTVLRGDCRHSYTPKELIDLYFFNTLIVYCRPPAHLIHQGAKVEKQFTGVEENLEKLIRHYDELMLSLHEHGGRVIEYNYEDPRMRIIEKIKDFLRGEL